MERVADVVRDLMPCVAIAASPLHIVRIAAGAAALEAARLVNDFLQDVRRAPLEGGVERDRRETEAELRAVRLEIGQVIRHLRVVLRDASVAREDRAGRCEDARRQNEHRTILDRQREARRDD